MDLKTIFPHLSERRAAQLINASVDLEAAVAAGVVPNTLFVSAKDTFNRTVDDGVEAFLKSGPKPADSHNSIWWSAAYQADALVSNAHGIPAALKRAQKAELTEYAMFLAALLPMRELLDVAKPLIAKKGDKRLPVVKTKEQIEREARSMTCQCCGRGILANMGLIAHHGYERPGHGWQTGSCVGARTLPFEVSRDALGRMISNWRQRRKGMRDNYSRIKLEVLPVDVTIEDRAQKRDKHGRYPMKTVEVTRETFEAIRAANEDAFRHASINHFSFDGLVDRALTHIKCNIAQITQAITEQQARYDGWKQTHDWTGSKWVAL